MQQKQDQKQLENNQLRYKIIETHSLMLQSFDGPHIIIQMALEIITYLQMLKFPIDYFSQTWFGSQQFIFSYLDLSYYIKTYLSQFFMIILYGSLIFQGFYILFTISLFKPISESYKRWIGIICKTIFVLTSTILYMPFLGIFVNLYSCTFTNKYWPCKAQLANSVAIISTILFAIYHGIVFFQSLLKFDFLQKKNKSRLIRDSSLLSFNMLVYILVNEIVGFLWPGMVSAIVLDICCFLQLVIFKLKDQHKIEICKQIQASMLLINTLAVILMNFKFFFNFPVDFFFLSILSIFVLLCSLQYDSFNIKFELENINKWNTSVLMLKYCRTLETLMKRVKDKDFQHMVKVNGYLEIHLQKCQMSNCPLRKDQKDLSQGDQKTQQVKRIQQLIKKIYSDGCKITPVNQQLLLEFSIFLYENGLQDASLKHILQIQPTQLSLIRYYKYCVLKWQIRSQLIEQPIHQFLDLVSQLQVRRMQTQLLGKFQKAALINLQFWSVLNQDHPDFQKLNDIGTNRIKIGQEVRKNYQQICNYAHNQKITNLYIHYLSAIDNDQEIYNKIYTRIKQIFQLDKKIILQDWGNSSQPMILISNQDTNFGTITDLNSTCASMLGYQKYQLLSRHFKIIFQQDTRSQMEQFISPQSHDKKYFYLLHKNGYILKTSRKVQNYNSMETGITVILTLNFSNVPYTGFFLFNSQSKILGQSSSCISLFGIENKTFENLPLITDLFTLDIENIQTLNSNSNGLYYMKDLFCQDIISLSPHLRDHENDQYSAVYKQLDFQFYAFELSLVRQKKKSQILTLAEAIQFEFHIEANLSDFTYIGQRFNNQDYLRQYSQFATTQQLNRAQSIKNYGDKIITLRLHQNIIKVIQQQDSQVINQTLNIKNQQCQIIQKLGRKDSQLIFENKQSYQKFIRNYKITINIHWILLIGLIISITLYAIYLWIFIAHNDATSLYFSELSNQNLIIGTLAKQSSYLQTYQLHMKNLSSQNPQFLYNNYIKNLLFLQNIRLIGSSPSTIPVYLSKTITKDFFSDQFLLAFINYGLSYVSNFQKANSSLQIQINSQNIKQAQLQYLFLNSNITKNLLQTNLNKRTQQINNKILYSIYIQIFLAIGGIFLQIIFGIFIVTVIYKLNNQKIKILSIFLQITQQQILKFSSKTQRFLTSLHMEDATGDLEIQDQQNQNKRQSAIFAKKKRFKIIKINKSIYFKLLLIPLVAQAYFMQGFFTSYNNLNFMRKSIYYISYVTSADTNLFSQLANIQKQIIGGPISSQISINFLNYYRKYFDSHYETFGNIDPYHKYFTNIYMKDICSGTVQIPLSCDVPLLSSNGSLLIFTDITVRTQARTSLSDFSLDYYKQYQIISQTHQLLALQAISYQNQLLKSVKTTVLNIFIIWMLCLLFVGILYGIPVVIGFLQEINYNKNMVGLIPVSMAKQSSAVNHFMQEILGHQHYRSCCC